MFTLAGVVVGAGLTYLFSRSKEHEQWLRDNRKEEYRELLSAISEAFLIVHKYGSGPFGPLENQGIVESVKHKSFRILHDRIFIADELKKADIRSKWIHILNSTQSGRGISFSAEESFTDLESELVRMALNDPREFGWFCRFKKLADDNGLA